MSDEIYGATHEHIQAYLSKVGVSNAAFSEKVCDSLNEVYRLVAFCLKRDRAERSGGEEEIYHTNCQRCGQFIVFEKTVPPDDLGAMLERLAGGFETVNKKRWQWKGGSLSCRSYFKDGIPAGWYKTTREAAEAAIKAVEGE